MPRLDKLKREQREKVRSGFSSQLYLYILNKTWFFSCDRIPKQAIYVPGCSTSQNRVAPTETVPARSLFIFIGASPKTDWLDGVIRRDAQGFIITGPDLMHNGKSPLGWPLERSPFLLEASVPGIFAAGDVRSGSIKRVASGVGEGSIAIQFVHRYLSNV